LSGAPTDFRKRRTVHVRVDDRGDIGDGRELTDSIAAAPALLRGRCNPTEGGRARIDIDRAEAGDTQRVEADLLVPIGKYSSDAAKCFFWRSGGHNLSGKDLFRSAGENGHALCPAKFDAGIGVSFSDYRHHAVVPILDGYGAWLCRRKPCVHDHFAHSATLDLAALRHPPGTDRKGEGH